MSCRKLKIPARISKFASCVAGFEYWICIPLCSAGNLIWHDTSIELRNVPKWFSQLISYYYLDECSLPKLAQRGYNNNFQYPVSNTRYHSIGYQLSFPWGINSKSETIAAASDSQPSRKLTHLTSCLWSFQVNIGLHRARPELVPWQGTAVFIIVSFDISWGPSGIP